MEYYTWLMFSISECSNQIFFFKDTTWNRFHCKFTCCKTMGIHFSLPSSATSKVYLLLFEIIKNGVKVTILVILKLLLFMVTPTCEQKDIILRYYFTLFKPHLYPLRIMNLKDKFNSLDIPFYDSCISQNHDFQQCPVKTDQTIHCQLP